MPRNVINLSIIIWLSVGSQLFAQSRKAGVINYIHTNLQKNDGGYGWEDQPDGHITPTFAVVGILYHLNQLPSDRSSLSEYIRTHHPQTGVNKEAGPSGTELRNLVYQQIQSLLWLNMDVQEFAPAVKTWRSQRGNHANFEKNGNPVFMQEMMTPICRSLTGLPQSKDILPYMMERRRENGSFNNVAGGDGNIINTYWGLYALQLLEQNEPLRNETMLWVQSCQLKNGGFTHQPQPKIGANDDVAYTWAAVKSLEILKSKPKDAKACINYLLSLQNHDGGFGNQPGLPSTPMATYYAIESLKALGALSELNKSRKSKTAPLFETDFSEYNIYTVQFQAHGTGSPSEAVMLADRLGIHLWGAKNADPEWLKTAQRIADEKNIRVGFFHANEDYGKHVQVEGMGSFNHLLDPVFPANSRFNCTEVLFDEQQLKNQYINPLLAEGGALVLQVSNNEPLTRVLLDESLLTGGYAAISTIHFGQNFLFWLPHLYQYRHRIPFVALQDAHGQEPWWWMNELTGYRTLFLAKEPTYAEMMKALKNNWMVAVRHDEVSYFKTRMLGGAPGVQKYIMANKNKWQWWDEENHVTDRPLAAISIIKPDDRFEKGRPEKGVNIRIRCWWDSNRQILKNQRVKVERMLINGIEAEPEYVQEENRGQIMDSYYIYSITDLPDGEHSLEVVLWDLEKDSREKSIVKFDYTKK